LDRANTESRDPVFLEFLNCRKFWRAILRTTEQLDVPQSGIAICNAETAWDSFRFDALIAARTGGSLL
jgi:hypothetical protein